MLPILSSPVRGALVLCVAASIVPGGLWSAETRASFGGATPLSWSQRMAKSEMARGGPELTYGGTARHRWDYTSGLLALSLHVLGDYTGNAEYTRFGEHYVDSLIEADGAIRTYDLKDYNLDMVTPGKVVLRMLEDRRDEKLLAAVRALRKQLTEQPRTTDGGFWHKQRYPSQMWLDGLYMAAPFYAHYGVMFKDAAAVDDAAKQFRLMDRHAFDAKKGLHYHAWNEDRKQDWADQATGRSPNFWGRAEGWYAMALVDVLDFLPTDHADRPAILDILRRTADGIVRYQDAKSGLWWQVLDQGGREGNYLEATASCMFVYSLTKAVNRGYLPGGTYLPTARRGYESIIRDLIRVDADGTVNLLRCCSVAGLGGLSQGRPRDGTFEYYISERIVENDLKGVGPFILAGIELDRAENASGTSGGSSTGHRAGGTANVFGAAAQGSAASYSVDAGAGVAAAPAKTNVTGWDALPAILARIKAPIFANRDFPITRYGAAADDTIDDSDAIRQAIEACHAAGGGRVLVAGGTFLTGAIHLKSNVNLHVAEGATLQFVFDLAKYPVVFTRWEGVECMNYSPLIYAFEQENIGITGKGTLDGGASNETWWAWNPKGGPRPSKQVPSRNALFAMGEEGVPVEQRVFGPGHFLRPNFVQPYRCRNVLIEDLKIRNSPMWEIHPVLCTNVIVRGLDIVTHGPNNDGCDPESSRDVLIENCLFDTGDDCIAIKSGRNNDGRRVDAPSENIVVRNCVMKDGHGGVVMGSEISGHCRNVFIENCQMDSPNLDRALRFKNNAVRGGVIENVFMRNVTIGQVAEAVLTIDLLYEEGAKGAHRPIVRNVSLENVTSNASPRVMWIAGFEGAIIDDIRFADCTFRGVEATERMLHAGSISFANVTIEPARAGRSLNSPTAGSAGGGATR